jgi:hypothetical protein
LGILKSGIFFLKGLDGCSQKPNLRFARRAEFVTPGRTLAACLSDPPGQTTPATRNRIGLVGPFDPVQTQHIGNGGNDAAAACGHFGG